MPMNAGTTPANEKIVMSMLRRPAMKSEKPNDKESEKSYVSAIARGLWISYHSCQLFHGGI